MPELAHIRVEDSNRIAAAVADLPISSNSPHRKNEKKGSNDDNTESMDRTIYDSTVAEIIADEEFLSSIELTPEQIGSLKKSLYSIHGNSYRVTEALLALSRSRVNHEAMMRSFLGIDDYNRYKLHATQKQYVVEIDEVLKPFLQASHQQLGDHESIVLNALIKTAATTLNFSDGPYDGIPNPTADPREAIKSGVAELGRVGDCSARALSELRGKIPNELLESLNRYYEFRIGELKSRIEELKSRAGLNYSQSSEIGDKAQRALEEERERMLEQRHSNSRYRP